MTRNAFITDERISHEGFFATFVRRVKEGQLGSLPVILALVVIVIVFQSANSSFLSPANLVNLSSTVAYIAILALGINLILLLGEIDLSLAQLGGLAASLLGVLVVRQGVPPILALIIMLLLGLVVGAIQGWFFAVIGIPAFVVTLAGLLAFTGLTLTTLGTQKNLSMSDTFAFDFANFYFPAVWAYVFGAVAIIGFGAGIIYSKLRRHSEGLEAPSWTSVTVRIVLLFAIVFGFLVLINQDFGLAMPFLLMIVIAIVIDLVLRKTRYGRSIYAVGGKVEAARRAGIRVTWVRISVFMAAGTLAALFGFIKAGVTTNAGSTLVPTQDLLNAIASAVIGGTSLFGGRGTAWAAVLGALVVGSINNGLYLIGFNSDAQQIITALVLLAAVVIDALSRRGQRYVGRG
ncbi:sugar ABC transporter permease [Brevibacterium sp. GP-SGM9]|uniref:sugar ABC transporter permease n=1 Tax=unclassified Brevibacterium TaxID=2614124 RepID=UPI001E5C36B4|nr:MULTISPECIES: ABC transporter permease [unclassified Brevibacterium]MCD1285603.1 ABC transporter permease [Brevibacterium sp. CCUG 69071]MDK8434658.1 ABC transporter permease [Brevibacterium sp. H-BE7]